MNNAQELLRSRLRGLRETYISQLPVKVHQIEAMWAALQDGPWDLRSLETLHRAAHSLVGSGATLGYPEVTDQARELENRLRPLLEQVQPATPNEQSAVRAVLDSLRDLADHVADTPPPEDSVFLRPPRIPWREHPLVYLVGGVGNLVEALEQFGYQTHVIPDLGTLQEAITREPPDALVLDTSLPGPGEAAWSTAQIQNERVAPLPVLFISAEDDLVARLQAVHAGGNAYVTHPVDLGWLVDKLDELTGRSPREPYRILIVEDEPLLSAHTAAILEQAGMVTSIVNDPLKILEPLREFRADLILMDLSMPGCSGVELATVLRQHEDYLGIPIVFLSTETRLDRRLQAMAAGGDDFLVKPVRREHLVSSIAARVSRARTLRSMMERDSLTRLLNHSHFKSELETELARAQRRGGKLAYVMLDIDHFKSVNDTQGHRAGDRVLKGLARLLQERFRVGDLVGRYGGEEFVVALIDADLSEAGPAIEEVRAAFGRVSHAGRAGPFKVTFSAGVADFPRYPTTAELHEAADRALYQAKRKGRNRVVLSSEKGVRE